MKLQVAQCIGRALTLMTNSPNAIASGSGCPSSSHFLMSLQKDHTGTGSLKLSHPRQNASWQASRAIAQLLPQRCVTAMCVHEGQSSISPADDVYLQRQQQGQVQQNGLLGRCKWVRTTHEHPAAGMLLGSLCRQTPCHSIVHHKNQPGNRVLFDQIRYVANALDTAYTIRPKKPCKACLSPCECGCTHASTSICSPVAHP